MQRGDVPNLKLSKMKAIDLKNGKEFLFETPENDDPDQNIMMAECSFSECLNKFCIHLNGQLFTFKTFLGMMGKLDKLIAKWNLEPITEQD